MLAALALGLFLSAPALAQGGSSGPSAGDNQYIDPLAQAQPKHKLHAKPHRLNLPPTTASSSGPAQAATPTQTATPSGGVATVPAPVGTGVVAVAHKKKTASSHPKKATATRAVASHKASTTAAASPPPAVSSSSHPGSSFPYVYLIVAICAALGAALLGRHVLLRRAAGRT